MLPENMALSIIDVLNFHQKQGHFKVTKQFGGYTLQGIKFHGVKRF